MRVIYTNIIANTKLVWTMDNEEVFPIIVRGSIAIIDNEVDGDLLLNRYDSVKLTYNFYNNYSVAAIPLVLEHTDIVVGSVQEMYTDIKSCDVECIIDDKEFLHSLLWLKKQFYGSKKTNKTLIEFLQSLFPAFSLKHFNKTLIPIHVGIVGVGARRETLIKSFKIAKDKQLIKRNNLSRENYLMELAKCLYNHKQTSGREMFLLYDAEKSNINTDFTCANLQSTRSKMADNSSKGLSNIPLDQNHSLSLSANTLMDLIDRAQQRIPNHNHNRINDIVLNERQSQGNNSNQFSYFPHQMGLGYHGFNPAMHTMPTDLGPHNLRTQPTTQSHHQLDYIQHIIDNKFKGMELSLDEKINNFSKSLEKNIKQETKPDTSTANTEITNTLIEKLSSLESKIMSMSATQPIQSDTDNKVTVASLKPKKRSRDEMEDTSDNDVPTTKKAMNSRPITADYISELICETTEQDTGSSPS